ncbi:MAG: hypothetical protein AAGD00_06565 [Planctomycetota bacterium]
MSDEQAIIESLKPLVDAPNALSQTVVVERLDIEVADDHDGDPAVYATVVLSESTTEEQWTSAILDPIADKIREAVAEVDRTRFVYVTYSRPSDLDEDPMSSGA